MAQDTPTEPPFPRDFNWNIFLTQNLIASAQLILVKETYLNWADSTAVVFLSRSTILMFLARRALINALSCFLGDKPSTYLASLEI